MDHLQVINDTPSISGNTFLSIVPCEFDLRPQRLGYTMRGWDFTRAQIAEAINNHSMLNPAMELASNVCPWNCSFCFTEDPSNVTGLKRRLANEMTISERLTLIDDAARLGARSINFVGAGEPTIDPHFWTLLERMAEHSICPIIYTEGALRLTKRDFVRRLYQLGATVVIKVNSLWNAEYQNSIVRGLGTKTNIAAISYTERRNKAIRLLIEEGFADSDPTRLAFDTIVCRQNVEEIVDLHIYARTHNIFILMVNYLPSGRSTDGLHDELTPSEQLTIFEELARIDKERFGLHHQAHYPYAGGVPCSIRGTGLYVKVTGSVFDCPGELISLGNVREELLNEIWQRARPITLNFDGRCTPRDDFWKRRASNEALTTPQILVQIETLRKGPKQHSDGMKQAPPAASLC
jgi:MoaA/NifB/PqqE/SkfB family radical SAM enzyme